MAAFPDAESSSPPIDAEAIASRNFSSSFRGWDPDEVRVHLVSVAETVRALRQREAELERRLAEAEAAARKADLTQLDPDEVDRLLGEETAKVLRTARESAAEITAKATSQAELLTSQAADDAAERRSRAEADAEQTKAEAAETAEAIRSAGEAHVAEVRAAGEAELADLRAELEAELAEARQQTRDECAELVAEAEDRATTTQREAEEAAQQIRAEADQSARSQQAEAESYAQRITTDAERMRDAVLSDLARRRKAARQHLEQLHAGRERLLAAYEVIRITTEQATDELGVVLSEAKHAADDAARSVGAEPVPSVDEMLAELEQIDLGDPEVRSATVEPAMPDEEAESSGDDVATEDGGDGAVGSGEASEAADRSPADDPNEAAGGVEPASTREDAPAPATDGETARAKPANGADGPPGRRRHGRRAKRRGADPLEGDTLPEGSLEPIAEAADFEQVRVVGAGAGRTGRTRPKTAETETVPSRTETGDSPPTVTEPASPTESSGSPDAAKVAESAKAATPAKPTAPSESSDPGEPDASPAGDMDAQASGIFERLRALQREDAPATEPAKSTDKLSKPTDKSSKPDKSGKADSAPDHAGHRAAVGAPAEPPTGPQVASDERMVRMFERRDEAVEDVARRLAKHLKRHLSDQQSELLDELRRARKLADPETYLGDVETFCATWRSVTTDDLASAVTAGSLLAGELSDEATTAGDVDLDPIIAELTEAVAIPLRTRLARALGDADDDVAEDDPGASDDRELADRIRACYREWRGARLTAAVSDACGWAFGEGLRSALPEGMGVRWYTSPGAEPCSDCNDNELAGVIEPGAVFPTGRAVAPAHPGCRCLALPPLESSASD